MKSNNIERKQGVLMKRKSLLFISFIILLLVGGCENADTEGNNQKTEVQEEVENMRISVESQDQLIIYQLNDSLAAKDLYAQLPLTLDVQDYSTNEKIYYPPNKLDTNNTPSASYKEGVLAYYAPWGDVIMFYGEFQQSTGLYELGHALIGHEDIEDISGTITIAPYEK